MSDDEQGRSVPHSVIEHLFESMYLPDRDRQDILV